MDWDLRLFGSAHCVPWATRCLWWLLAADREAKLLLHAMHLKPSWRARLVLQIRVILNSVWHLIWYLVACTVSEDSPTGKWYCHTHWQAHEGQGSQSIVISCSSTGPPVWAVHFVSLPRNWILHARKYEWLCDNNHCDSISTGWLMSSQKDKIMWDWKINFEWETVGMSEKLKNNHELNSIRMRELNHNPTHHTKEFECNCQKLDN